MRRLRRNSCARGIIPGTAVCSSGETDAILTEIERQMPELHASDFGQDIRGVGYARSRMRC